MTKKKSVVAIALIATFVFGCVIPTFADDAPSYDDAIAKLRSDRIEGKCGKEQKTNSISYRDAQCEDNCGTSVSCSIAASQCQRRVDNWNSEIDKSNAWVDYCRRSHGQ